ncbi:MAG: GntR family transcriptional regulator [Pseudomonadota bacterium]
MPSQTETIVDTLLAQIDAGALNPGDRLDEAALAARFAVSRTPVREAVLRLEAWGILLRRPRGGAVVFRPTLEEFLAILEVHARLEGQAAGLAARRLSPAGAQAIERTLAACTAHHARHGEAEGDAYYALNMEFHAAVALAAANPVLLSHIKMNARRLMAYYRVRYRLRGAISASISDHEAIAAAVLDGDAERADALMTAHVQFDSATAYDLLAMLDTPV